MDARKLVLRETGIIALGEAIGIALMFAVFALIRQFDQTVLLGGLIGGLLSILNFFFMAINTCTAADKAAAQDVKGGKSLIRLSYTARLIVIFAVLFACVKSGYCHAIASVVPLVFIRPIITIAEFFRKPEGKSL